MKHRISPATLIASLALFFSLTGAGMAASRYLITSVSQIKPSGRHALRGERGPQGAPGAIGPQGAQGPAGTVDWSHAYIEGTGAALTAAQPTVTLIMQCRPGDQVISGGYSGVNEIVTADQQVIPDTLGGPGWEIVAHLDPNAAPGAEAYVRDEAFCAPTS